MRWALAIASILTIGGIKILMLRILGKFFWRSLDEGYKRPQSLIEQAAYGVQEGGGCNNLKINIDE